MIYLIGATARFVFQNIVNTLTPRPWLVHADHFDRPVEDDGRDAGDNYGDTLHITSSRRALVHSRKEVTRIGLGLGFSP